MLMREKGRTEMPCVLAVDDEQAILVLIQSALQNEGFTVVTAASVAEFWDRNAECEVDIYIIDITLQDGSGYDLVKKLRKTSDGGILMLSGRGSEIDHVLGLELGADDYVTKPFRLRELSARVSAIHRRVSTRRRALPPNHTHVGAASNTLDRVDFVFDDYHISLSARRLWGPGKVEIALTTAEFELLTTLIRHKNQVLSRDQIMNAIKGQDWASYDRAIDGLVSRLRKKIPPPEACPQYIRTVHGVGYSFIA